MQSTPEWVHAPERHTRREKHSYDDYRIIKYTTPQVKYVAYKEVQFGRYRLPKRIGAFATLPEAKHFVEMHWAVGA